METWYMEKGEIEYQCPYCGCEIMDYTGDEVETRIEYCNECGGEFRVEVID